MPKLPRIKIYLYSHGWFTPVKIRQGQTIRWHFYKPTDEGARSYAIIVSWPKESEFLFRKEYWGEWDCDGLTKETIFSQAHWVPLSRWNPETGTAPPWKPFSKEVYDQYAQLMGY